ncbi:MAG: Asp-tRNA(Asn)/Glu-tRNA(Gln) amidotransferase subunit GatC [Patescibacteria group bacterium]|jgi:aspartyl-tRNA(Asn)/glutamyl-tRNA(Gln) amidotransferase subunit C|nr:Asp-tRNA(Asn)/Glu-tRNA(Gln) amidotransferase subunit GatC [Patescibacteria group bacterium]
MKLEKKDIEHIAKLARLELSEAEFIQYGDQLSDILGYIDQLQEVDTSQVEPTAQVTGLLNGLREDKDEQWLNDEREDALSQAPELENHQVKVKRVL